MHIFDDGAAGWFAPFAWIPVPFVLLVLIALLVWVPFRRSVTGRAVYAVGSAEGAAYMSGLPIARAKIAAFTLGGFFAGCGGLFLAIQTSSGNADIPQAGAYTLNSIAAVVIGGTSLLGGSGGAIGSIFGAHDLARHLLLLPHLRHRPLAAAAVRGPDPAGRRQRRGGARAARQEHAGAVPMTAMSLGLSRDDRPILFAALFILVILVAGTAYTIAYFGSAPLLSPTYLLQQLQIGSFLGIVGGRNDDRHSDRPDRSVGALDADRRGHDGDVDRRPAALSRSASASASWSALVNGIGVAYLRVPSMIFTLGVNAVMRGLMVAHTGGFAPQTGATDLMQSLASERTLGIPDALFVWTAVSVLVVVILQRTPLGRYIYAIGNKEAAAYLAGVNTRRVTVICFMLCGLAAALAGILLAGYSTKAYQAMGDFYLLPSIAAVVIGGTNILGGRGRYLGTLVGVVLIVLLNSVLSIMAMPEAGRQMIYGLVIILMLLVYGRGERVTS